MNITDTVFSKNNMQAGVAVKFLHYFVNELEDGISDSYLVIRNCTFFENIFGSD